MGEQLRRFQKRALELEPLEEVDVTVPPGFEDAALREFANREPGDWTDLKREFLSSLLSSLSNDRDVLIQLREKEKALQKELGESEAEQERRLEELKEDLRGSIRAAFPDASQSEQKELALWLRQGGPRSTDLVKRVIEREGLDDPFGVAEVPSLWKQVRNKDWWREKYPRRFRQIRYSLRPLQFRLGMVRLAKRCARAGALDKLQGAVHALPDLFNGRPTLRDHAERLVKKYRRTSTSLPTGMEAFKEWVPDGPDANGRSIVAQMQTAFRKEDISDRYDDPESFCELVKRLLERHFDARSKTF